MVQVGWVVRLALPEGSGLATFAVLVVAEIAVPVWAERAAVTTWHPHHIAERYGLFTLIVLGESITAATGAVHASLDTHAALGDLAALVVGGILTVFALWWLYFAQNAPQRLTTLRVALLWGYGHYFVFASAAAVGSRPRAQRGPRHGPRPPLRPRGGSGLHRPGRGLHRPRVAAAPPHPGAARHRRHRASGRGRRHSRRNVHAFARPRHGHPRRAPHRRETEPLRTRHHEGGNRPGAANIALIDAVARYGPTLRTGLVSLPPTRSRDRLAAKSAKSAGAAGRLPRQGNAVGLGDLPRAQGPRHR